MAIDLSKYKKATTTQATGSPTVDLSKYKKPQATQPQKDTLLPQFKAVGNQPVRNVLRTFANIPSSAERLAKTAIAPINPFDTESPVNIGANIVKGAGALKDIYQTRGAIQGTKDIIGGGIETAKKGVDIVTDLTKKAGQEIRDRGIVGAGAEAVSQVAEVGIEDPLLIPSIIYAPSKIRGTGVVDDTISRTARPVIDVTKKGKDAVIKSFEPTTSKLESVVVQQFQKGIKPRINMNMTPTQSTKFEGDIVTAAKVIDKNKANLKFVDDIGDEIVGRNPQTLSELSDALEQTKKQVFQDYDALAQQAGNQGLKINTNNIAKELDTVIGNEALQITNPQAIKYAQELKDRLSYRELDAKTVQDVIQNYNESLKAFYRNPTYDSASKASIDAMIANQMRQQLDEGITSLTGQQYQAIKNQYSSLKAIEKDVIKAALRDARKNNKSLIDYTDILTGGDIVTGLITFNPTALVRGAGARGIKEFYKYLNSPNRAVKKMFQSAERLNQRSIPNNQAIPSASASVIPSGTSRVSTQPSANIPMTPNTNVIPPQSNTLPKKSSGLINRIKNTPNKEGGFIRLPQGNGNDLSLKVTKSVDDSKYYDIKKGSKKIGEVETLKDYFGEGDVHIQFIGVDESSRGRGVATKALQKVIDDNPNAKTFSAEPTNQAAFDLNVKVFGKPTEISNDIKELTLKEARESLPKTAVYNNGELDSTNRVFVRFNKPTQKPTPTLPKSKVNESVSLPNNTTDLIKEARKYKSAEEFVKAQGTPVYHGTDISSADSILKNGVKIMGIGNAESGISLSTNKNISNIFSGKDGKILDLVISPDTKLMGGDEFDSILGKLVREKKMPYTTKQEQAIVDSLASKEAKKLGYDGVDWRGQSEGIESLSDEIRIWNTDKIKTKSQLEQIWKEANKK